MNTNLNHFFQLLKFKIDFNLKQESGAHCTDQKFSQKNTQNNNNWEKKQQKYNKSQVAILGF